MPDFYCLLTPFIRIINNEENDDNRVVMWVVNPFSILVRERNGLLVSYLRLESWTFYTTLRYVFLDLEDCPVEVSPMMTLISPSGGLDGSSNFAFNFSSL